MCGRYANARLDEDLISQFGIDEVLGPPLPPSWNIAPTQQVRFIRETLGPAARPPGSSQPDDARPQRELLTGRWGLIPPWAKDRSGAARLINARSETVATKPAFRAAAAKRRCVVPGDGYYEWMAGPGGKTPYYLHPEDDQALAFAGLYEAWADPTVAREDPTRWVITCTIITRAAPDALGHIHDRSPVVVPPSYLDDWLNPTSLRPADIADLLAEIPPPALLPREVGRAVGNVHNNGPGLIAPV